MDARRYRISLRVFNSISHELNTRREIPCLQATMYYYFFYHINTLLTRRSQLYWRFKKKARYFSVMVLTKASDVSPFTGNLEYARKKKIVVFQVCNSLDTIFLSDGNSHKAHFMMIEVFNPPQFLHAKDFQSLWINASKMLQCWGLLTDKEEWQCTPQYYHQKKYITKNQLKQKA